MAAFSIPASAITLVVTKSSGTSTVSLWMRAFLRVFMRDWNMMPSSAPPPTFWRIMCVPRGVLLLPASEPVPYLDVETGKIFLTLPFSMK